MTSPDDYVIGADGCTGESGEAWAAARLFADGRCEPMYFATTAELWQACAKAQLILLDVPIGLPDEGARTPDAMARDMIGPRRSSVFPAPERWLLECTTIEQADQERAKRTGRNVKVQRQMWNIVPRIRAVDQLLRSDARARANVREVHPELCAAVLAGRFMQHYKKDAEGEAERLAVIETYLPNVRQDVRMLRGFRGVATDDAIDAMLCVVTAAAVFADASSLRTIPQHPTVDSCGLRMEMVYRVP
jgi:predicted RNase H-like nuclease